MAEVMSTVGRLGVGGVVVLQFPTPTIWTVGRFLSETAEAV